MRRDRPPRPAAAGRAAPDPDPLQHGPARDRRRRHRARGDLRDACGGRPRRGPRGRSRGRCSRAAGSPPGSWARPGCPTGSIVDGAAGAAMAAGPGRCGHRRLRPGGGERRHRQQGRHLRARGAGAPPRHPVPRRGAAEHASTPPRPTATAIVDRGARPDEVRGFGGRLVAPPRPRAPGTPPSTSPRPSLIDGLHHRRRACSGRRSAAIAIAAALGRPTEPRRDASSRPGELLVELLRAFYASGLGVRDRRRHLRTGRRRRPAARAHRRPQGAGRARRLLRRRPADGHVVAPPDDPACGPASATRSSASRPGSETPRSVVHSHALTAVLAAISHGDADHIAIRDLEMLKGIRGPDQPGHPPACRSSGTPRASPSWSRSSRAVLARSPLRSRPSRCSSRDHGAYIWGDGRVGGQAAHRGLPLPVRGHACAQARPATGRERP